MAPSSDERADIIRPSLLMSIIATGLLTSAHPSLLDRKHNMHSVCKRKHNLHTVSKKTQSASNNIHQIQQKLNIHRVVTYINIHTHGSYIKFNKN
jgi:hypothetical protein